MLLGKLGASMPRLANRVNASALHRRFLQALLGVHRKKKLPEFAPRTFERWLGRRKSSARGDHEVVLFHTCFVNFYNPELGRDTVEVLERNGATVCSPAQTCCGMPAMETGNVELAREQVRANIRTLAPYAERGAKILAINPTCSYMLKKESVDLAGPDLAAQARKVAEATRDVCEHLFERKREERFDRAFKSSPGEVAYHVPCHLKAQNIGFRSRDMMRTIPDVSVRVVDRCCGHDGTWAMRTENFEASLAVGAPAFDEMKGGGFMTTDCPLAAVQFEQATGVRPIHPVQVLARAYRGDSFPSARPAASTETAE
jgi:Fe-S oxidoreductase